MRLTPPLTQIFCCTRSGSRSAFGPHSRRRSCLNWSTRSRATSMWSVRNARRSPKRWICPKRRYVWICIYCVVCGTYNISKVTNYQSITDSLCLQRFLDPLWTLYNIHMVGISIEPKAFCYIPNVSDADISFRAKFFNENSWFFIQSLQKYNNFSCFQNTRLTMFH